MYVSYSKCPAKPTNGRWTTKDSMRLTESPSRATTNLESRVHPRVTESEHHAYTINTTLTQELQGLKYRKESQTL